MTLPSVQLLHCSFIDVLYTMYATIIGMGSKTPQLGISVFTSAEEKSNLSACGGGLNSFERKKQGSLLSSPILALAPT